MCEKQGASKEREYLYGRVILGTLVKYDGSGEWSPVIGDIWKNYPQSVMDCVSSVDGMDSILVIIFFL